MNELKLRIIVEYYQISVPLFWSSSAEFHKQSIAVNISDIKGLEIKNIIKKPYKCSYLTMVLNFSTFINSIYPLFPKKPFDVIKRLELVFTNKDNNKIGVFNKDLTKIMNLVLIDAEIPKTTDEIIHYYRTNNSWNPILENKAWSDIKIDDMGQISSEIIREYIGFTGQNKENMANGKELKCEIINKNREEKIIDYIFINNVKSLRLINNLRIKELFIMPDDILEQAKSEFLEIVKRYNDAYEIKCCIKLFDFSQIKYSLKDIKIKKGENLSLPVQWNNFNDCLDSYLMEFYVEHEYLRCSISNERSARGHKTEHYSLEYNRSDIKEQLARLDLERRIFGRSGY